MGRPAAGADVTIYRGDTTPFGSYRMRGDKPDPVNHPEIPGPVLDVHTWLWAAQWRDEKDDTTFIELDLDLTDAANGFVTVEMSAEGAELVNGPGYWDLQATIPGEGVITKVAGKTKYIGDVTRDA